jgi:membrane-associated phospholipid phosphatase
MEDVRALPLRARFTRLQLAIAGLAAAFATLAALVVAGALSGIDRYALAHWMPGLDPAKANHVVPPVNGVFMPFSLGAPWWQKALDVSTYPASVLVSVLVFAGAAAVLVRRGSPVAAGTWVAAFVGANALEVMLKVAIAKPKLYRTEDGTAYHLASFDHSFPSGHTMRALLVAGVIAYTWKRLAWPAAVWAALVPVFLVAASAHVPSDVAGGAVFGLLAVLATHAALPAARARFRRA